MDVSGVQRMRAMFCRLMRGSRGCFGKHAAFRHGRRSVKSALRSLKPLWSSKWVRTNAWSKEFYC